MNKTIIININGIVFHIEEDAYEVLIKYMNEVKQHFGNSADSYEIVNDIENRLAEMFSEKLAELGKEVIVLADVAEVTAQMGKPSDFEQEEEEVYEPSAARRTERKLFRDTDDRIIGGVCAGIGHYFDVEPRWIRIFTLLFILLGGSGFFLYVVLWIVMPKASSRADKMAMKGEAPNLQNFKKSFEEEMQAVKQNIGKAQQDVQPFFQRLGRFIEQLFAHLGKFLGSSGKVLLKIIGGFIVLTGGLILFALLVGLLALLGVWNAAEVNYFPFNIVDPSNQYALYISAFLVILIPLISLIILAFRVLFNRPALNRNVSFGLLMIWLAALSTGIFYGFKTAGEFKEEARYTQTSALKASPVYYLELNEEKFLTKEDSLKYRINEHNFRGQVIINGENHELPDNFELNIESGEVKEPLLITQYMANGKSFEKALQLAKNIQYRYVQQDSVIRFDRDVHFAGGDLWRNQRVKVILRIPVNTRLIINHKLNRYLNDYYLNDCIPGNGDDDLPSEWIMTKDGLTCKNDSLYKQKRLERGIER
ncbi:MAG: PspC domain-containing protein [Sphingobacteriaceae bacterium]